MAIVAASETITTIVDNGNNTFTYTAENGSTTTISIEQSVVDTNGIIGVAGATTSVQSMLDAIVNCLYIVENVSATTQLGADTVSFDIPAGFVETDLSGVTFELIDAASVELSLTDYSVVGTTITYKLSGVETRAAGHEIKAKFIRLKFQTVITPIENEAH